MKQFTDASTLAFRLKSECQVRCVQDTTFYLAYFPNRVGDVLELDLLLLVQHFIALAPSMEYTVLLLKS